MLFDMSNHFNYFNWKKQCGELLAQIEYMMVDSAQTSHDYMDGSPPIRSYILISLLQLQHESIAQPAIFHVHKSPENLS